MYIYTYIYSWEKFCVNMCLGICGRILLSKARHKGDCLFKNEPPPLFFSITNFPETLLFYSRLCIGLKGLPLWRNLPKTRKTVAPRSSGPRSSAPRSSASRSSAPRSSAPSPPSAPRASPPRRRPLHGPLGNESGGFFHIFPNSFSNSTCCQNRALFGHLFHT